MSLESIAQFYNQYSRYYDRTFGRLTQGGWALAPRLLALYPGARVLEVGIGTGLSLDHLPRDVELTGIDMSEKMLALAHRKVEKLGLRGVRLLRMDGMNPRFEDGEFDRVLAAYVTSVVADPCRLVRQMKRVCRKGGYLVFLNHFVSENPILRGCERMVSPICHRIGFRTGLDLQELMKECDLEIESVSSVDFLGIWKAVRCVNP